MSNGYIENMDTFINDNKTSLSLLLRLKSISNNVAGNKGIKMVFSWTWKLKRKKASELLSKAYRRVRNVVDGDDGDDDEDWEKRKTCQQLGAHPSKVVNALIFTNVSNENHSRSLSTILIAHQTFATLSSYNPL